MKKIGLYVASFFLALHGLIEVIGLIFLKADFNTSKFILEQLQNNVEAICLLGVVFGIVRIFSAIGILLNRKWGMVLGILISTVTYAVMTLYLPMGIADGIFSGIVLISLLMTYYGKQPIVQ